MDKEITQKPNGEPTVKEATPIQSFVPGFLPLPFIRFSLSSFSMLSDGRNTHIQAEDHRFENGKLDSRHFEGTFAGDYMTQVTRLLEHQMAMFFNAFNMFLPFK